MICHFCGVRFAFADESGEERDKDLRQREMESDAEAVCVECDKKFQG